LTRREWQRVRIVVVLALVLTVFTLAATLWRLELFHLRTGSSSGRAAGWAWLVVYVAIPIMLAASVVRQEAAGGRREFVVEEPLMPLFRALLAVYGAGLGVLGLGLSFWPSAFHHVWAWPV